MSDLAIILVHYRTPTLLVDATRALQRDLQSCGLTAEILVVDNGSDATDRVPWGELPWRRIDPGANLGYAGGVRCGVEATSASRIVAMNPDVLVSEGCLARLLTELERGAAAAGPQFYWDGGRRLHLPPTESRSAAAELRAALARRFPDAAIAAVSARRAWRRHARRHWEATRPIPSTALSGALLAFRRDAWTSIGPFDEAFRLYFEETDWLLRLAAAGLESRFVPEAHAVHLFAQSSIQEPQASAWFAEGEQLFRRRHLGTGVRRVVEALAAAPPRRPGRRPPPRACVAAPTLSPSDLGALRSPAWIEVSFAEKGFPAAAERFTDPAGAWQMPAEIWQRLPPGELWIRAVGDDGQESAPVCFERGAELAAG